MNREDEKYCERWLCFWSTLSARLTEPVFTENILSMFIVYESHTRKRLHVLDRLMGRYYKLVRQRRWQELMNTIGEEAYEGNSDRRILETRSLKVRRKGY